MYIQDNRNGMFSHFDKKQKDPGEDFSFKIKEGELQSIYPKKIDISLSSIKNFPLTEGSKSVDKKNTTQLLMQEQEKYDNKLK